MSASAPASPAWHQHPDAALEAAITSSHAVGLKVLLHHPAVRVDRFAHLRILDRLHQLHPNDPAIRMGWIQAMLLSNRPAPVWGVTRHWSHAPEDDVSSALIAAQVAQVMGEHEEARQRYRNLLKRHPDLVDAWQKYVDFEQSECLSTSDIAHLETLYQSTDAYVQEKAAFALAGYHSKTAPGQAFLLAQRAHQLKRKRLGPWQAEAVAQRLALDRQRTALPAATATLPRPLFVLGLPRSGTTLLTRLLGSHRQVAGLGEQNLIPSLATTACQNPHETDPRLATFVQAWYRAAIGDLANGAAFVVDKLPANVEYIGLILSMFPDALVIPMQRNLADCAMSMHLRDFEFGCLYADHPEDLVNYAQQIAAHVQHWATLAPDRVLPVQYESLVMAPRQTLEPLLSAIGLQWEEGMLDFWQHAEQIATFSEAQVRQPLHASSIGSAQRFLPEAAEYLRICS